MSVGDMAFDPSVPDKIWFAQGIGVSHTSFPVTGVNSVTWTIFPSFPGWNPGDWPIGGSIAASTRDNIIWVPANRKREIGSGIC